MVAACELEGSVKTSSTHVEKPIAIPAAGWAFARRTLPHPSMLAGIDAWPYDRASADDATLSGLGLRTGVVYEFNGSHRIIGPEHQPHVKNLNASVSGGVWKKYPKGEGVAFIKVLPIRDANGTGNISKLIQHNVNEHFPDVPGFPPPEERDGKLYLQYLSRSQRLVEVEHQQLVLWFRAELDEPATPLVNFVFGWHRRIEEIHSPMPTRLNGADEAAASPSAPASASSTDTANSNTSGSIDHESV